MNFLFYVIGIAGIYFLYRTIKKQATGGSCVGCSMKNNCKEKKCIKQLV